MNGSNPASSFWINYISGALCYALALVTFARPRGRVVRSKDLILHLGGSENWIIDLVSRADGAPLKINCRGDVHDDTWRTCLEIFQNSPHPPQFELVSVKVCDLQVHLGVSRTGKFSEISGVLGCKYVTFEPPQNFVVLWLLFGLV